MRHAESDVGSSPGKEAESFRFGGDEVLEEVAGGKDSLEKSDAGIEVVKLQQALADLGYDLPSGVDGDFGGETEKALLEFQADRPIPETGILDQATLDALDKAFDTRQPYLDQATFDPADPDKGTRSLDAGEKGAIEEALAPKRGTGGRSSTFQEVVEGKSYGDRMKERLGKLIPALHKELYADREPLRSDPDKNFHEWNVLEETAEASKEVTDAVYGSYATGPKMTAAAGNFVDQWEDEKRLNAALSPDEKKRKAADKVSYLIVSNCRDVNEKHAAIPSDSKERSILTPIIESFVDTPAKVETILQIEMGWPGAQLEGEVYLQRFKKKDDADNREQLWGLFHTCIHEYLHSLAHDDFQDHAASYYSSGDTVRYNSLTEGFCDFFTQNVRETVKVTPVLRQKVEGPYYDSGVSAPSLTPGVYPSIRQAEQVISITGIRNAQSAYFRGEVALIGGS